MPAKNGCTPTILVEDPRLMRDLIKKEQHLLSHFQKVRLKRYEMHMEQRFHGLLDRIRQARLLLDEKQELIDRVEDVAFEEGISPRAAHAKLQDRYVAPPWFATPEPADSLEESMAADDEEEVHDELSRLFAELTMEDDTPANLSPQQIQTLLKDYHRELARRLHPDRHPDATPEMSEWWHETQAAHRNRDLGKLELLLVLTEPEPTDDSPNSTSSGVVPPDRLEETVRHLRQQLETCRAHPAWDFDPLHPEKEERQFEKEHKNELAGLRRELNSALGKIRAWESKGTTADKPRKFRRLEYTDPLVAEQKAVRSWLQLEFEFIKPQESIWWQRDPVI